MNEEIRWRYRFRNFSRAYSLLSEALERAIEDLNQLEREGVVQRFEYTFELAWKTLKDHLECSGVILNPVTPRNVFQEAASAGLVMDGQVWEEMIKDRNKMSHRFDCDLFEEVLANVRGNYLPAFGELYQRLGAEMSE